MGKLAHVNIVLSVADIGQKGDGQKVGKQVGATSRNSVIGYCHKDFVKHDSLIIYGGNLP